VFGLYEIEGGRLTFPFLNKIFYDLSLLISALSDSRLPEASSLIDTLLTLINFTLRANIKVDLVYRAEIRLGLIFAIRWVFELPPNESLRRNVSLESL